MNADEFYRSKDWDEGARLEFDKRIRRVPKGYSRARRFEDKAHSLFTSDDPVRQRAAVALLARGLDEAQCDDRGKANLLQWLAIYQVTLGERAAAIESLRRCIALGRPDRLTTLPEELLGRCLRDERRDPEADDAFAALYRFRDHETRGSWRVPAYDELEARDLAERDPDLAAEGIRTIYEFPEGREPAVFGIANANRAALAALDAHYALVSFSLARRFHPLEAFDRDYLLDTFLPQLGAYVGRALVAAGGSWRVASPLMKSRIVVHDRVVNPFRAAYDVVFFGHSLARLYDRFVEG